MLYNVGLLEHDSRACESGGAAAKGEEGAAAVEVKDAIRRSAAPDVVCTAQRHALADAEGCRARIVAVQ